MNDGGEEKQLFAFLALIVAAIGSSFAFNEFIERGVNPDLAAGYAVVILIVVLGAFGVVAVGANL